MIWTNYHSHCRYCDGKGVPEEYVAAALEKKLVAYGFSSHAPVPFRTPWAMAASQVAPYISEIRQLREKYAGQIQLYCGMEVDFIPDMMSVNSPVIRDLSLDYTVGSVHFLDFFPDGTPCEMDGSHQLFLQGLEKLFDGDIRQMVGEYYFRIREMVGAACPAVVGHLDKIKMQSEDGKLFSENAPWYQQEITQTLQAIAESGAIVEVNTRGVYKKKTNDFYPGRQVLEQMHALNIPVMINSDCHHPDEIALYFTGAALTLREVGYREIMILFDGQWQAVPFSPAGIAW